MKAALILLSAWEMFYNYKCAILPLLQRQYFVTSLQGSGLPYEVV